MAHFEELSFCSRGNLQVKKMQIKSNNTTKSLKFSIKRYLNHEFKLQGSISVLNAVLIIILSQPYVE